MDKILYTNTSANSTYRSRMKKAAKTPAEYNPVLAKLEDISVLRTGWDGGKAAVPGKTPGGGRGEKITQETQPPAHPASFTKTIFKKLETLQKIILPACTCA